ncbi:MAG TPA: hypothetical protein VLY03_09090 [Bacteroidota bacterium]|nr:hypothetical protein [Bacteroidota bacterium]
MNNSEARCAQSCRGLCAAIDAALQREKETILQYASLRDKCQYPEVNSMLNELILQCQKSILLIEDAKSFLKSKFEVLEQIQDSFDL